jgi:hypothetical protein
MKKLSIPKKTRMISIIKMMLPRRRRFASKKSIPPRKLLCLLLKKRPSPRRRKKCFISRLTGEPSTVRIFLLPESLIKYFLSLPRVEQLNLSIFISSFLKPPPLAAKQNRERIVPAEEDHGRSKDRQQ